MLTTLRHKNVSCYESFTQNAFYCTDTLLRPKKWKRNTRFGTWNFRTLYRSGSLTAAARELVRYKLYLVGVQEVRWDRGGRVRGGVYNFFYGKRNENNQIGTGVFVYHRILSAVKTVEFIRDRMSYIVLRGRWCDIIFLKVHAPNEGKSDCSKDSFYEELEQVFYHFPSTRF